MWWNAGEVDSEGAPVLSFWVRQAVGGVPWSVVGSRIGRSTTRWTVDAGVVLDVCEGREGEARSTIQMIKDKAAGAKARLKRSSEYCEFTDNVKKPMCSGG